MAHSENRPAGRNPIDTVERLAISSGWHFERKPKSKTLMFEIVVEGQIKHSGIFVWKSQPRLEVLHLTYVYDITVPPERQSVVATLCAEINKSLQMGDFKPKSEGARVAFCYGIILSQDCVVSESDLESLLSKARALWNTYFPAFQAVAEGKSVDEALKSAMIETAGSA